MSGHRISPTEALDLMNAGYMYLDVRTPAEFAEGHPKGAINVPLHVRGEGTEIERPEFVAEVCEKFPSDAKIVVGCRSGNRSRRAYDLLSVLGFGDVKEQRAGFDGVRGPFGEVTEPGWKRLGLPVTGPEE